MTIRFETSDNRKVTGIVVEDLGHAYVVKVTSISRKAKQFVGRTLGFSKAHMLTCEVL
jgi:hypothetical protein